MCRGTPEKCARCTVFSSAFGRCWRDQEPDRVSMYQALDRLNDLVDVDDEYQGGCTGLDALVYHLDWHTVDRAIKALERVRDHFKVC